MRLAVDIELGPAALFEERAHPVPLVGQVKVDALHQELRGVRDPGTARVASATTVPVGATIRLAPSSVVVPWAPHWFDWIHHWLLASASAG